MSRSGDEDFVAFVSASSPTLLRTAWLLCGNAAQAEDLVQEALERVYLKWGRVSRGGRPLAYTRTVLVNLNTDRWRRTHRETVTDRIAERATADAYRGSDDRDQIARLLLLGTLVHQQAQQCQVRVEGPHRHGADGHHRAGR